ncbi:hypothetical protein HMPREF3189_01004 [Clostridiales bacterium KA00134]|nr:hypothetical protein HMPREF3189_01004 [Clostridiales bacterium KA00134]
MYSFYFKYIVKGFHGIVCDVNHIVAKYYLYPKKTSKIKFSLAKNLFKTKKIKKETLKSKHFHI